MDEIVAFIATIVHVRGSDEFLDEDVVALLRGGSTSTMVLEALYERLPCSIFSKQLYNSGCLPILEYLILHTRQQDTDPYIAQFVFYQVAQLLIDTDPYDYDDKLPVHLVEWAKDGSHAFFAMRIIANRATFSEEFSDLVCYRGLCRYLAAPRWNLVFDVVNLVNILSRWELGREYLVREGLIPEGCGKVYDEKMVGITVVEDHLYKKFPHWNW